MKALSLLWWRVSSRGLQDASQHLVVVEWLVLFGGVTGTAICCVGIREPQNPKTIRWQHYICLLWVENWAGRRTGQYLKTQQENKHIHSYMSIFTKT